MKLARIQSLSIKNSNSVWIRNQQQMHNNLHLAQMCVQITYPRRRVCASLSFASGVLLVLPSNVDSSFEDAWRPPGHIFCWPKSGAWDETTHQMQNIKMCFLHFIRWETRKRSTLTCFDETFKRIESYSFWPLVNVWYLWLGWMIQSIDPWQTVSNGCGDHFVGQYLVYFSSQYTGVKKILHTVTKSR